MDPDTDFSNLFLVLKNHYIKSFESFIREIDISFEYIDKSIILKNYACIDKIKNSDIFFKNTVKNVLNILEPFKENIKVISKPRTKDFDFFNTLIIFDIDFRLFYDENKNTKKTLVNYLLQFYTNTLCIDNLNTVGNTDPEIVNTLVKNLIPNHSDDKMINALQNITNKFSSNESFLEPFSSLMQNKEIMSIANEVTSDIASMNIDPMTLLSSLMTGNTKGTEDMSNFITKLSNKITSKIQNGDIDKSLLEEQAKTFMKTFM